MKATAFVVLPNVDYTPTFPMKQPPERASQRIIQLVVGFLMNRYQGVERTGFAGRLVAMAYT